MIEPYTVTRLASRFQTMTPLVMLIREILTCHHQPNLQNWTILPLEEDPVMKIPTEIGRCLYEIDS